MTYLEELESAIVKLHGCEATFLESTHVGELFRGKPVWQGDVEIFALAGCARATRCYAWGHPDERGVLEVAAILEIPPVDSAAMAVRVALAAGARQRP